MNQYSNSDHRKPSSRSGNLFFFGVALLFGTQGYQTAFSDNARLVMLGSGLLFIVVAALLRPNFVTKRYIHFFVFSFLIVGVLLALQFALSQETLGARGFLFQSIIFVLFIGGVLLGSGTKPDLPATSGYIIVLSSLVIIPGLYLFFQYSTELLADPYRHLRSYDIDRLHPIGVAYAASILLIIFARPAFETKSLAIRSVALITMLSSLTVMIVTGSRGAILYILLTGLIMLWVTGFRFPKMAIPTAGNPLVRLVVGAVLALISAGLVLSLTGDVLAQRGYWLVTRFEALFQVATGNPVTDLSTKLRFEMWGAYLENWILAMPLGMKEYQGYPHNMFLEWFARFGILGVALAVWVVWVLMRAVLSTRWNGRSRNHNGEGLMVLAMLVFAFLQSMSSLSLEMNRALFLGLGYFSGVALANRECFRRERFAR